MYQTLSNTIRIEDVAAKLEAIERDGDASLREQMAANPRRRELLLFLCRMDVRPGAQGKFLEEFLAMFPERIGTPAMVKAQHDNYTLAEKLAIFGEIPGRYRPYIKSEEGRPSRNVWDDILCDMTTQEIAEMDARDLRATKAALDEMHSDNFKEVCRRAALEKLPGYFTALCTQKGKGFEPSRSHNDRDCTDDILERASGIPSGAPEVWYFQDVIGALVEFMDRWTVKVQGHLAMTAVVRRVFETVDEVLGTGEPCFLRGDSRFGKTESLKLKAEMHPGRLVFVPVPRGNSLRDLLNNIAESLGIDRSYGSDLWTLGSRIRYIFHWTGLVPLFDEGAWLIPGSYSKTTQPDRLNWLRSELFDRGVPAVIAVTPQWYDEPLKKFKAKTKYASEQFTGRCPVVELPVTLDQADLVRVAAFHFPEFKRKAELLDIAAVALTADGYLKAIEQLSKHARYIARRDGVPLTMDLTRRAMKECYPNQQTSLRGPATAGAGGEQTDFPGAAPRRTGLDAGGRVNEPCKTIAKGIQSAGMGTSRKEVLDSSSARGARLDREAPDLVPVEA